jgi:hypothetical protein
MTSILKELKNAKVKCFRTEGVRNKDERNGLISENNIFIGRKKEFHIEERKVIRIRCESDVYKVHYHISSLQFMFHFLI